jgi:hypothetical protein
MSHCRPANGRYRRTAVGRSPDCEFPLSCGKPRRPAQSRSLGGISGRPRHQPAPEPPRVRRIPLQRRAGTGEPFKDGATEDTKLSCATPAASVAGVAVGRLWRRLRWRKRVHMCRQSPLQFLSIPALVAAARNLTGSTWRSFGSKLFSSSASTRGINSSSWALAASNAAFNGSNRSSTAAICNVRALSRRPLPSRPRAVARVGLSRPAEVGPMTAVPGDRRR